jgi:ubiquinone/menaquinone biosynthesis C-methylase UbiE
MSNLFKDLTTISTESGNSESGLTHPFSETPDIETSSDCYAARFSGEIGQWFLNIQERATLKMLEPYAGGTLLDVGGGHGQLTPALVREGYRVTVLGSDASCQNRIQDLLKTGSCKFVVGNAFSLPFADNAFDVVISYRFLAHIQQWQRLLSELNRVAAQATIVDYPTVKSFNSISPLLFKLKQSLEGNTRPYVSYDEAQLLQFLQSIEAKPDARYAQFFWPMVLHRILKLPQLSSALEMSARLVGLTSILGSPVILKSLKG